jgi:hypothetical protein
VLTRGGRLTPLGESEVVDTVTMRPFGIDVFLITGN